MASALHMRTRPPGVVVHYNEGAITAVQRITSSRLGLVVLGALVLAATPRTADATVFVVPTDAELTAASDVVLTGTVTDIRSVLSRDGREVRTFVTLAVSDVLKGRVRSRRLTIREPGGQVRSLRQWIHGAPEFAVGEEVLLFLQRRPDGTLGTTGLGLGKYRVMGKTVGVAARELDAVVVGGAARDVRSLRSLTATVRHVTASAPAVLVDAVEQPTEAEDDSLPHEVVSGFTFLGPGRWNEVDDDETIEYLVDHNGEPALGLAESVDAVAEAMAAWTAVPTSAITLAVGGTAPPRPMACDGVTQIVFNDPFGDVPDPTACSGILALGGFCGNSSRRTVVNGVEFIAITEANITFNNGFSTCGFWNKKNIAEVLTHEIGHSIGLGHSSERSLEPNTLLADATMYFRAHFDGRGAAVRPDDIDGISTIYPGCDLDDVDCDGVANVDDNCPEVANAGQMDTDADGSGDLCDTCPTLANADQTPLPGCSSVAVENLVVKRSPSTTKDRLRVRGSFTLAAEDSLDAGAGPLSFLLADGDGNLLQQDVTAQAAVAKRRRVRLQYRSADGSLVVKVRSRDGQTYTLAISGKQLALHAADAAPILTTVGMGSHSLSAVLTNCKMARRGRRFVCAP